MRLGPLKFSSPAFDSQEISALFGESISRDVLSTPQLNFSNERIWNCARQLADESQFPGAFSALYCESLILTLTIELLRLDRSFGVSSTQGGLSQRQLRLATEYIQENLAGRVSLLELAELTGLGDADGVRGPSAFHSRVSSRRRHDATRVASRAITT